MYQKVQRRWKKANSPGDDFFCFTQAKDKENWNHLFGRIELAKIGETQF